MEQLYTLLIDTLNLLILPVKETGVSYTLSVQNQIDELEGDYYTFLHKDNVQKLIDNGEIPTQLIEPIEQIRTKISELEPKLWNSIDFINSMEWQHIRELVLNLFIRDFFK